jgi:hypothetical protein
VIFEELLKYLGLEWALGSVHDLPLLDQWPASVALDSLHNLRLGGVLALLTSNRVLPQRYNGDSTASPERTIHISEELNGLASLCHQKENNHSQRVARIVQIKPFAKSVGIHDFPDFKRPLTSYEAFYEAEEAEWEMFDLDMEIEHQRDIERRYEEEHDRWYESNYGVPPTLDQIGLRRHVVDVGQQHLVAFHTVVVAYTGSLAKEDAKIQVQAVYGDRVSTIEAHHHQVSAATEDAVLIKIALSSILIGRLISITVLPLKYSQTNPKRITLQAVELFGTVFELPANLIERPSDFFRFDDLSGSFKRVDAHEVEQ